MTDDTNYSPDVTESSQPKHISTRKNHFLPPDFTEQFDASGRLNRPDIKGDGRVKRRPSDKIAAHQLKTLRIERALAREAEHEAAVAKLCIDSRPDRLLAPCEKISAHVLHHFRFMNLTQNELRSSQYREQDTVVYARHILIELCCRHSRLSANAVAAWLDMDHSSISTARRNLRARRNSRDAESRALRSDINAITLALAEDFGWIAPNADPIIDRRGRLLDRIDKLEKFAGDLLELCNDLRRDLA